VVYLSVFCRFRRIIDKSGEFFSKNTDFHPKIKNIDKKLHFCSWKKSVYVLRLHGIKTICIYPVFMGAKLPSKYLI